MKNILIENEVQKNKIKIPLDWMFLFYCYMGSLFIFLTFRFENISVNLLPELIVTFIYSFYSSHLFYFLLFPLTNNANIYNLKKRIIYWVSFKRLLKVLLFFYLIPGLTLGFILGVLISKYPLLIFYFTALLG